LQGHVWSAKGRNQLFFLFFSAETEESGRYLRTMAAILYFSGEALYAGLDIGTIEAALARD